MQRYFKGLWTGSRRGADGLPEWQRREGWTMDNDAAPSGRYRRGRAWSTKSRGRNASVATGETTGNESITALHTHLHNERGKTHKGKVRRR